MTVALTRNVYTHVTPEYHSSILAPRYVRISLVWWWNLKPVFPTDIFPVVLCGFSAAERCPGETFTKILRFLSCRVYLARFEVFRAVKFQVDLEFRFTDLKYRKHNS